MIVLRSIVSMIWSLELTRIHAYLALSLGGTHPQLLVMSASFRPNQIVMLELEAAEVYSLDLKCYTTGLSVFCTMDSPIEFVAVFRYECLWFFPAFLFLHGTQLDGEKYSVLFGGLMFWRPKRMESYHSSGPSFLIIYQSIQFRTTAFVSCTSPDETSSTALLQPHMYVILFLKVYGHSLARPVNVVCANFLPYSISSCSDWKSVTAKCELCGIWKEVLKPLITSFLHLTLTKPNAFSACKLSILRIECFFKLNVFT